jgi:hypothetical protein
MDYSRFTVYKSYDAGLNNEIEGPIKFFFNIVSAKNKILTNV